MKCYLLNQFKLWREILKKKNTLKQLKYFSHIKRYKNTQENDVDEWAGDGSNSAWSISCSNTHSAAWIVKWRTELARGSLQPIFSTEMAHIKISRIYNIHLLSSVICPKIINWEKFDFIGLYGSNKFELSSQFVHKLQEKGMLITLYNSNIKMNLTLVSSSALGNR